MIKICYNPQPTVFFSMCTETQRLLKPSDMPRTNVYLIPVICPKPKNRVVQFLNFLCLCVSVRLFVHAITPSLIELES